MDRGNPALASQADALHPAVLRLIALACEGAAVQGRPVGVCGGMASDPATAVLLVGLGASSLSVATGAGGAVKAMLGRVSLAECRALAVRALKAGSAQEVRSLLDEVAARPEPPERIS
jgi:phosphoenolpyruvate-protein kinase (PTS system EI component)